MGAVKQLFTESTLAKYGRAMKAAPREVIFNRSLLLSALLYATSGIPLTWDQGSSSVVPSLPGFQDHFGINSGSNAKDIRNYVSIVYVGCGVGAGLSFLIHDRIGRLWSLRLYMTVWIIGQLIAAFAPNLPALYAARIISGFGIGPLTVTGPMSIVEIAPTEIRGLLTAWFGIMLLLSLFVSVFCVYGVFAHVASSRLQYQIVWFSPAVFLLICIIASFFLCESPRWLTLVDRREEAVKVLVKLRGLPADHPRVREEIQQIDASIEDELSSVNGETGAIAIIKEAFLIPSNLRRVQQALISFALAQLTGANSVTAYFVPILTLIGIAGNSQHALFLSGMYSMAKFFFTIMASFFFIDALGRRWSLFIGILLQMTSDIYIGVYIKYKQQDAVNYASSQAAIAAIFVHGFGYAIGLLILPYVFGGELWPNRIRSFGSALSQCFHWLFYYGINFTTPSILAKMDNWGAFLFFAGWCFVSLVYVFFMVPEISQLSVEQIDEVFRGPWFNAYKRSTYLSTGSLTGRRNSNTSSNGATVIERDEEKAVYEQNDEELKQDDGVKIRSQ